ncbi:nitrilase-related carbon-nitrogen hydrolase [Desulfotignum balticum]|uniref:nitrilase-related carbon-nitrogen hydrolase n=1 Tax=Desulfotignum balticum TaxID=115781 RepID=UPI0004181B6D|nr:nitrilase-related carbon-nitrogen hydrolase [Desulfotignum balticum]
MKQENRKPIAPYMAIGLSTVIYGTYSKKQTWKNMDNIENAIRGAIGIADLNMPIKLIALSEGAITGFTDEVFDTPHKLMANEWAIDIPGYETKRLGALAKEFGVYIIAQSKARWPEVMEDIYINTLFIMGPDGTAVHKAPKNHIWCREHSVTPHDIYDRWVEVFGDGLEAFYPVLKTEDIGNIGTICCSDGEYPEVVRALTMNGAEVIYRPSEACPMTNSGGRGGGSWMTQNRGHAEFNSVYMICPQVGPVYVNDLCEHPMNIAGGHAHIVDYRGELMAYEPNNANSMVAATIDIEALRQFRDMSLNFNWLKDLRTELFKKMYDTPIYPKNLVLDRGPIDHAEADVIYRDSIKRLQERGVWEKPYHNFEGARYTGKKTSEEDWRAMKDDWKRLEAEEDE